MMESGNPNWHNMQQLSSASVGHGHGHVQSNSSSLFSLLHHQLNLHGGPSNSSPSSSNSSSSSSTSSSSPSTSSLPFNPLVDDHSAVPQDFPQSWSQLLLSGLASGSEEERLGLSSPLQVSPSSSSFDHPKVTPNNESLLFGYDHHHHHHHHLIKQEGYSHGHDMNQHHELIHDHQLHPMSRPSTTWSHMVLPVSSPTSCVTTLSSNHNNNININTSNNNLMDFSSNSCKNRQPDQCNSPSAITGGAPKKPRVQSSSIPPLKVRKEKLGDRITALHQLVSPFGKTDTASVLLETIGCIRFLQGQIQALSSPYLGNPPSKNHHFNYVMKDETLKDLRSKGLCLVPISSTQLVGCDNNTASEYWAPSIAGGF